MTRRRRRAVFYGGNHKKSFFKNKYNNFKILDVFFLNIAHCRSGLARFSTYYQNKVCIEIRDLNDDLSSTLTVHQLAETIVDQK